MWVVTLWHLLKHDQHFIYHLLLHVIAFYVTLNNTCEPVNTLSSSNQPPDVGHSSPAEQTDLRQVMQVSWSQAKSFKQVSSTVNIPLTGGKTNTWGIQRHFPSAVGTVPQLWAWPGDFHLQPGEGRGAVTEQGRVTDLSGEVQVLKQSHTHITLILL